MLRIKHINCNPEFTRGTIAINLPSREHLLHMQTELAGATYLFLAATFVHPKEQYNKKTGRKIAEELALNQQSKYCVLTKIEPRENRWVYHFTTLIPDTRLSWSNPLDRSNKNKIIGIEFGVALCKNAKTTGLEYATFKE